MDRATEVLSQLHFDYTRTKPVTSRKRTDKPTAAADSPPLSLEQRYEQWKRFWQSIDTPRTHAQRMRTGDQDSDSISTDEDTERLLRWFAFSRQQDQPIGRSQPRAADAQSAAAESPLSPTTSSTRTASPHSPTYYVNLARFLSTAPNHRHRQQYAHTGHTKPDMPQRRRVGERVVVEDEGGVNESEGNEQQASGVGESERVEIVVECSDDQHVAHRYIHKPAPTISESPTATTSHSTTASATTACPPSCSSPPTSRPSSAYSFTNLPREHIRPAASAAPKAASFSLHSYFARMSVPQLHRYLQVFNPSLLSSSLALTKDQLIAACCSFYRTRIASQRSQPASQASEQVKRDAAKEAIVVHTARTYAHLSLPSLLHTITAATTLTSPPAVLSGVGYADERSVKSGYRRCMLRVHPDKHTLSGWEEQTRCVELFRLVQDKYALWQRSGGQR